MSVILKGVDMPKSCDECDRDCIHQSSIWHLVSNEDINNRTSTYPSCPLKSIEGLIEEIEKMKKISSVTGQGVWNECLHYVISTIKEYCEVE